METYRTKLKGDKKITHQCPMQGGNAVFFARSLYSLVDKDKQYDDFKICNLIGIELRKPGQKKDGVLAAIYPNPANESATLTYSVPKESKIVFTLRTTTSQRILNKTLQGGDLNSNFVRGLFTHRRGGKKIIKPLPLTLACGQRLAVLMAEQRFLFTDTALDFFIRFTYAGCKKPCT